MSAYINPLGIVHKKSDLKGNNLTMALCCYIQTSSSGVKKSTCEPKYVQRICVCALACAHKRSLQPL